MQRGTVKQIMVPLADYATVPDSATLQQAVLALEQARLRFGEGRYPHQALLVLDPADAVVGKLSQMDVIHALDPRLGVGPRVDRLVARFRAISRYGFGDEFIQDMVDKASIADRPLDDLCRKAAELRVRDIMYTPGGDDYVAEEATLDEAVRHLARGHHHSLLVTGQGGRVVGVLRLTDVFALVSAAIRACGPPLLDDET